MIFSFNLKSKKTTFIISRVISKLKKNVKMFNKNFERIINEIFNNDPFFNGLNNWEKRNYKSDDGKISFTYITNKRGDLEKPDELTILKERLEMAVDEQNFEEAVELRDKIKNLETNIEKIGTLQKELDKCVKVQNFERAIEIRNQINSLK